MQIVCYKIYIIYQEAALSERGLVFLLDSIVMGAKKWKEWDGEGGGRGMAVVNCAMGQRTRGRRGGGMGQRGGEGRGRAVVSCVIWQRTRGRDVVE